MLGKRIDAVDASSVHNLLSNRECCWFVGFQHVTNEALKRSHCCSLRTHSTTFSETSIRRHRILIDGWLLLQTVNRALRWTVSRDISSRSAHRGMIGFCPESEPDRRYTATALCVRDVRSSALVAKK
jgi:hypothetical protein